MMAGFQAEENLTGRAPKKCAKNSGRYRLELNPRTHQVSFGGRPLELTYVEYSILQALMRAPRVIFPRKRLLNLFADKEWNKFDRSVDVHISTLRKKLADATGKTNYIRTVRSAGYMFVPQDEDTPS